MESFGYVPTDCLIIQSHILWSRRSCVYDYYYYHQYLSNVLLEIIVITVIDDVLLYDPSDSKPAVM